jgi:Tfp pilus assembly protein PilX
MIMKNFSQKKKEAGVTLFIAMVITATLLLISAGVVAIAVKEANISNVAKNSQVAFYAADSGVECALYWMAKNPQPSGTTVSCGGSSTVYNGLPFTFNVTTPYCTTITVTSLGGGKTQIESRGHNTCTVGGTNRVERALRVTY